MGKAKFSSESSKLKFKCMLLAILSFLLAILGLVLEIFGGEVANNFGLVVLGVFIYIVAVVLALIGCCILTKYERALKEEQ